MIKIRWEYLPTYLGKDPIVGKTKYILRYLSRPVRYSYYVLILKVSSYSSSRQTVDSANDDVISKRLSYTHNLSVP